jgi:hypothetical protein
MTRSNFVSTWTGCGVKTWLVPATATESVITSIRPAARPALATAS